MFINTHITRYTIVIYCLLKNLTGQNTKHLTTNQYSSNAKYILYCYITDRLYEKMFSILIQIKDTKKTGRLFWSDFLYIRRNEAGNAQRKLKNETLHTLLRLVTIFILPTLSFLFFLFSFLSRVSGVSTGCFAYYLTSSAEPFATACARTAEKQNLFFAE